MRNIILAIAIVLVLAVGRASATNFWLSPSNTSSAPPANADAIPTLPKSGNVYVWGRPDAEKTLINWSLNIHTSNPGVINFTGVNVVNPLLGHVASPPPPDEIRRYELINEPAPADDGQSITSFRGLSVVGETGVLGVGIGPDTTALPVMDPYYDATNDSWLLASIAYAANGGGSTNVYLQIGMNGLNNLSQNSAATNVILGALTDPALNGFSGRNQDSASPEARIIPEPSSVVVAVLGMLALACLERSRVPGSLAPHAGLKRYDVEVDRNGEKGNLKEGQLL